MLKILDSENTPIEISYIRAPLIMVENLHLFMASQILITKVTSL